MSNANSLAHHGILGMHWGVRRYQNKNGTLTSEGRERLEQNKKRALQARKAARKTNNRIDDDSEDILVKRNSQKLYRVGGENETNTGSTYAVLRKDDFTKYAAAGPEMEIYGDTKYTFATKNEMKIAGAKAQMDAIIEVYGSMPAKEFVSKLSGTTDKKSNYYFKAKRSVDKMFDERQEDELSNAHAFDDVVLQVSQKYMDRSNEIVKAVTDNLVAKGYSGVRDINDGTFAHTPVIVFDRSKLTVIGRKKIDEATKRLGEYTMYNEVDDKLIYDGR